MTNANLDRKDQLQRLSAQLDALLLGTIGERAESFRNWASDIQENYLWACSDMATQIRELLDDSEVSHG